MVYVRIGCICVSPVLTLGVLVADPGLTIFLLYKSIIYMPFRNFFDWYNIMPGDATDIPNSSEFAGLTSLLAQESKSLHLEDIEADIEGEKETLPDLQEFSELSITQESSTPLSIPDLEKTIASFSKGITDATEREYLRFAYSLSVHYLFLVMYSQVGRLMRHFPYRAQADQLS